MDLLEIGWCALMGGNDEGFLGWHDANLQVKGTLTQILARRLPNNFKGGLVTR